MHQQPQIRHNPVCLDLHADIHHFHMLQLSPVLGTCFFTAESSKVANDKSSNLQPWMRKQFSFTCVVHALQRINETTKMASLDLPTFFVSSFQPSSLPIISITLGRASCAAWTLMNERRVRRAITSMALQAYSRIAYLTCSKTNKKNDQLIRVIWKALSTCLGKKNF